MKADKFYGVMLISPVCKPPFEVLTEWEYKDGVWYGNGESYPEEICKAKHIILKRSESISENGTHESQEQDVRVKALIDAYAELCRYMTVEEIKAILGGDASGLPVYKSE